MAWPELHREAVISPCQRYRYLLRRKWGPASDGRSLLYVMLNPSTGDAASDDPTLRKCMHIATSIGYEQMTVANLFAWRSTDPKGLPSSRQDAVGPQGDLFLLQAVRGAENLPTATMVICAWGNRGSRWGRDAEVLKLIRQTHPAHALRVSSTGVPAHPLYLPNNSKPSLYYTR